MENKYICKHGLYHDKPVINGEPSSNNGWIYTAYAKKLHLMTGNYQQLMFKCLSTEPPFLINRLPDKKYPPISKDELIGMFSLNHDFFYVLQRWNFISVKVKKVPVYRQILAMLKLINKHRNYVWQNNLTDAYPIVFKLPASDRYYMKKVMKENYSYFEMISFYINYIFTIYGDNTSSKNILWLQLKDMNSWFLIRFIKQKENFLKYFGENHVFNKGL